MRLQKAFAVIGAGVLLFAAADAVTYAATGSSLVLGKINAANATTTIQNTGTTPALKLLTKSAATPPMAVNGKGKVANLYADRAATADNASKVGGKTVAQVVSSVPRPAGVIWVAQSGGQFTSVSSALASITDNDLTHRYVIKVAPGTYTEAGSVVLKNYVDIEGSGQDVTTIACACGSDAAPYTDGSSGVLQVTGPGVYVGIRNLTVANTGSALANSTGIVTNSTGPGDVTLDALTVSATGGAANYGIFDYSYSSPTMTNVNATATGGTTTYGIYNYASSPYNGSSPTMTNVAVTATSGGTNNYGIYNSGVSAMTVRDSFISGTTNSIYSAGGAVRVADTRLNAPASGSMTCINAFDAATFAVLNPSCQP